MSQAYTTSDAWEEFSGAFEQFSAVVTQLRSEQSQQFAHGHVGLDHGVGHPMCICARPEGLKTKGIRDFRTPTSIRRGRKWPIR